MKRVGTWLVLVSFILTQSTSVLVRAESVPALYGVVVNEIQTNGAGTGTTDQEFIELKNISTEAIDVSGWSLTYTPASGLLSSNRIIIVFPQNSSIAAGGFLVVAPSTFLNTDPLKINYQLTGSVLAADSGIISLQEPTGNFADVVAWGTVAKGTLPLELESSLAPTKGGSIVRKVVAGATVDTNSNVADFEKQDTPTPGSEVILEPPLEEDAPPDVDLPPDDPPITDPTDKTPPEPTETENIPPEPTEPPQAALGPEVVLLNELYIDPVSPETDASDEYVELYNPNDFGVDLKGYTVFAGSTYSYKYTFAESLVLPPKSYFIVTSADTTIALSNGGGAAKITAPNGDVLDQTTYVAVNPGEAWAKTENGAWTWTTSATKNTENIITIPLPPVLKAAAVKAAKSTTKKAPTVKTTAKAKTAKAKTTKVKAAKTFTDDAALIAAPTPLPWWLLAVLLVLAVLYIAYEYRFELNNTIYRLKQHRNNRR